MIAIFRLDVKLRIECHNIMSFPDVESQKSKRRTQILRQIFSDLKEVSDYVEVSVNLKIYTLRKLVNSAFSTECSTLNLAPFASSKDSVICGMNFLSI